MTWGTAGWIGRVWPGSTSFPNPMVAIGPNLRSGGGKFREIAEEMCGKEGPNSPKTIHFDTASRAPQPLISALRGNSHLGLESSQKPPQTGRLPVRREA